VHLALESLPRVDDFLPSLANQAAIVQIFGPQPPEDVLGHVRQAGEHVGRDVLHVCHYKVFALVLQLNAAAFPPFSWGFPPLSCVAGMTQGNKNMADLATNMRNQQKWLALVKLFPKIDIQRGMSTSAI